VTRRTGAGIALLADDTRRLIVGLVGLRPRRPWELAEELGLSRPAVSRQLSILARAGLVRIVPSRVDRRGRLVLLDPASQGRILAWLAGTDLGLEEALVSRHARGLDRSARSEPVDGHGLADAPVEQRGAAGP
jgi:DNA-binding transcriptional ArsR family regulator